MSIEQNNRRQELHNLKKEPLLELAVSLGCDVAMRSRKNIIHQILQKEARGIKETTVHQEGKNITTREHEGGRKDVHIEVKMLDVKENDPATLKAKGVIEKEVLPKLADADVLAIVVHIGSKQHTQRVVKLPQVRKFAEVAVQSFKNQVIDAKAEDFLVVEHHLVTGEVKVTTLT